MKHCTVQSLGLVLALCALLACGDAQQNDAPTPVSACCYWTFFSGGVVRPPASARGCWSYEGSPSGVPEFFSRCGQEHRPPFGSAETVIGEVCDESRADRPCDRHFTD